MLTWDQTEDIALGLYEKYCEQDPLKVRFTDLDVFQLPMRCPLPVIAAMQGHGIGAGWTLGLFCDSVLFSEESRYVSPYMNFGFTPWVASAESMAMATVAFSANAVTARIRPTIPPPVAIVASRRVSSERRSELHKLPRNQRKATEARPVRNAPALMAPVWSW